MEQYLPLVCLLVLAILFCVVSALISKIVSPKAPTAAKSAPYECGIVPRRDPPERFPVRFYLVAMIFIIFDIEIIFLYPYAVLHEELGAFGVWEMVVFAIAVFAFIEAGFRRRLSRFIVSVNVALAVVGALVLLEHYFWSVIVLAVLGVGFYILWENLRELGR